MTDTNNKSALEADFNKRVDEYRKQVGGVNIGAVLVPPLWGAFRGYWVTVLFYPLWIFADDAFYDAYSIGSTLSIVIACLILAGLIIATAIFARTAQSAIIGKAIVNGVSVEDFKRKERTMAIVCGIVAVLVIILATYWNLVLRPTLL